LNRIKIFLNKLAVEKNEIVKEKNKELQKKQREIEESQEKLKSYLEKAKIVIRSLDPSKNSTASETEISYLKNSLIHLPSVVMNGSAIPMNNLTKKHNSVFQGTQYKKKSNANDSID